METILVIMPFLYLNNGKTKAIFSERSDYENQCIVLAYERMKERLRLENICKTITNPRPRRDIYLYDIDAVNEALVNAIIHNDYRITDPHVAYFDDRLEIISRRGLPNGLTKEEFFNGVSKPRNEQLMDIFTRLGIVEHTGHGIPVIVEKYGENAFEISESYIRVTGREAVLSVQLLGDKINAIKMFVIPNNKEDIIEFLFFAISNFDAKLYATNKNENIAGAWYTKIEQCYQKAITMFVNQYDIDKVKKAYNEVQEKIRNIKKARLIKKISGIGFICLSILLIVLGSPQDSEGNTQVGPLSNIGLVILIVGIILLCSCKKKKAK